MRKILDACCGARMMWFDKEREDVEFVDVRNETHVLCDGRTIEVKPTTLADFKNLPFGSESFHLVVFDPPHLRGAGKNGWQAKKYGSLGSDWRELLKSGFDECWRVLRPNGTLIFKWNEQSFKVSEVIEAIGTRPLFGHRTMQNNKTIWMTFFKEPKA